MRAKSRENSKTDQYNVNNMKIATWNVNGLRASFDKGLLYFAKKASPDILCVQETKAHPEQLEDTKRNFYPYSYWSVCGRKKGYSGTAVFSKKPAERVQRGIGIKKFDWEGRVLIFERENFILLSIYFPNGALTPQRHLFKQEFLKRLSFFLEELKTRSKKELIIVGDYNVAYKDIDVYSPETLQNTSGFLSEERRWFQDFLNKGYVDVYRHFYPDKAGAYTWWSLRERARAKNQGWRIDHICITENLKSKVKSIEICDRQMGSDHCPLLMEIEL